MIRDFWLLLLLDLILYEDTGMPLPALPPKIALDQLEPFHASLMLNLDN